MSDAVGEIRVVNATPITPPRPFDVTAVLPQPALLALLALLARTAMRLRPCPGAPTPQLIPVQGLHRL
ncbi:hypothetical protein ACODT5_17900 [Streptomyces sp. 5.8]|uniref:hypothetical protein n=1 Tax=Streptomyces sp. 5.8 TaxID=3406571 RepID=UPI003BB4B843